MKAMQHNWYDIKSFIGAMCALLFAWMGKVFMWLGISSLQDVAIMFSIIAAATTIIYNVQKILKEYKNKNKSP
jgi:hypothetical protein